MATRPPSWPFTALGLVGLAGGALFLYLGIPDERPAREDLVKLTGAVERIVLRDDISGSTAGAVLPGWSSAYITLEGHEGAYRYPRNHPQNDRVRDATGGTLEIWIARNAQGGDAPPIIWQLFEDNPYKREITDSLGPETRVTYEEIITRLSEIDRSLLRLGAGLGLGGLVFFGLGRLLRRRRAGRARTGTL